MSTGFTLDIPISFGHCDPAGIVFYPNYFRWFDRCFHTFLRHRAGGHRAICARLGLAGIGLMDVGARFPAPAMEGDTMALHMHFADWGSKTLRLVYEGRVEGRIVVAGTELRGCFEMRDGRLRAGDTGGLRAMIDVAIPPGAAT